MEKFESLAIQLEAKGYFAVVHRQRGEWFVTLANNKIRGIPCGRGDTADAALQLADANRKEMEADKRYQRAA